METLAVSIITDKLLRGVLIKAATYIEKLLKSSTITTDTPLKTETPYGLRIDTLIESRSENKPFIYTFEYQMDAIKFKKWLEENHEICEGMLSFIGKGIEITVPFGPEKYDKSGFSIRGNNDDLIWLTLLEKPVRFRIH